MKKERMNKSNKSVKVILSFFIGILLIIGLTVKLKGLYKNQGETVEHESILVIEDQGTEVSTKSLANDRVNEDSVEITNQVETDMIEQETVETTNEVSTTQENNIEENSDKEINEMTLKLTIGDTELNATMVENSTTKALKEKLKNGAVTIDMRDYASMEKVGSFPWSLPKNDEQITTEAGDLILYQGNAFVIYYEPNAWNFTRIGKIDNMSGKQLKELLGKGNVSVTLSID